MMVKTKYFLFTIVSLLLITTLSTAWNFENDSAFSSILTFLSVIIGFSLTGLSIIATSSFSKNLYQIESKKDNSKTLLHELVGVFKASSILFILNIVMILIYDFLPVSDFEIYIVVGYKVSLGTILKSLIWYLTLLSFIYFSNMLMTFSKFIIRSVAKEKS